MTLDSKLADLPGVRATAADLQALRALGLNIADDVLKPLLVFPIIGVSFSLSDEADESEMGAELRILTASEAVDEATNAHPGIAALALGYLPIGECLEGSGDPYFVQSSDGRVVRIPHEAVTEDGNLDCGQIEPVCASLASFLEAAEPYATG